jgi:hypothetical protein
MLTCVIASGQSLKNVDLDLIRKNRDSQIISKVIAVSNVALDKCRWADAMISSDGNWFAGYPEYVSFTGKKFSKCGAPATKVFKAPKGQVAINSGLLGMYLARDYYKASEIIIVGFDMYGTHYFGKHHVIGHHPLKNTTERIFNVHIKQFDFFSGAKVYNANKLSKIERFEKVDLGEFLDARSNKF